MKYLLYLILCLRTIFCLSQTTKLIGTSTTGGSIFAYSSDEDLLETYKDFSFGQAPIGQLVESNGRLWGMTQLGSNSNGLIYSLDLDGTDFAAEHLFSQYDGRFPYGGLIESNAQLWGMTSSGGDDNLGVLFSLTFDGEFTDHYHFDGTNGSTPYGNLIEANGQLYGMTSAGGANSAGVIFSIDLDGTGYTKLYDFTSTTGTGPLGSLMYHNGLLWGMTYNGGDNGFGVVFSIEENGTNYTVHHDFAAATGALPRYSQLIISNNRIWGMAGSGGDFGYGAIFSLDLSGGDFSVEHSFGTDEGSLPLGGLTESNGKLWGATSDRGDNLAGTIFSIELDGTGFQVIHHMAESNDSPHATMIESGGKLWGTSRYGNAPAPFSSDYGSIFTIDTDGTNFTTITNFVSEEGIYPYGSVLAHDGRLWGMHSNGGTTGNYGGIYSMKTDGTDYELHHSFSYTDGSQPYGTLVESNGKFWGLTFNGGSGNGGVIFRLDTDGTNYEVVHNFQASTGSKPRGGLIEADGKLWGVTDDGGDGFGVIFTIETDGTGYLNVHNFDFTNGLDGYGDLVFSNNKIWGTTDRGGANNLGVIFSIDTDGSNYNAFHSFDNNNGRNPRSALVEINSKIWGMTYQGGDDNYGVIYNFDTDGTGFQVIHHFDGAEGRNPYGGLTSYDGRIWGLTNLGGNDGQGILFRIDEDGTNFTIIRHLTNRNGAPRSTLRVVDVIEGLTLEVPDKVYGDDPFDLAASSPDPDPIAYSSSDDNVISVSGSTASITGAGIVTLTATQNGNESDAIINVGKAPLEIAAEDKSREFGEANPSFTLMYNDFVYDDEPADLNTIPIASTTTDEFSDVGTYPIILSSVIDDNYEITATNGILTITQATLMADAEDLEKEYGDGNPPLSIQYSGFKNDDTIDDIDTPPVASTIVTASTNVGTYAIELSDGFDNNYTIETTNGDFDVIKANLLATADDQSRPYGQPNPTLTISYEGFKLTDNESVLDSPPAIDTEATQLSDLGAYDIELSGGMDDNYNLILNDGILTVTKAILIATADDKSKTYGSVNPTLTVSYSGFANGDDVSDLDVAPQASTEVVQSTGVGNYAINLSEGNDDYYEITEIPGSLAVEKANQVITFEPVPDNISDNSDDFTLLATASSGLEVYFGSSDTDIAQITGNIVTIVSAGGVVLTAYQDGNKNYNAATPVDQDLVINGEIIDGIRIFPNPVTDGTVYIVPTRLEIKEVIILDIQGKRLAKYTYSGQTSFPVNLLSDGLYFMVFRMQDNSIELRKLFISN